MPSPPDHADDAELVGRAAAGDDGAFASLVDRHVDDVHDHLARWSRDAALAAAATREAFCDLLGDLGTAPPGASVLPRLLRSARGAVVTRLRAADVVRDDPASSFPEVVLATSAAGRATDEARAAWASIAELDDDAFSAVDLSTRHGLAGAELATVLDVSPATADDVLDRSVASLGSDAAATVATYATLRPVRAPVPVRRAVSAAAERHFGIAPPSRAESSGVPRLAVAVVAVGVVALAALVGVLRWPADPPREGPPTVAAEPVAADVPAALPTPPAPATVGPVAAPPEPSPSPSPEAPLAAPVPSSTPDPVPTPSPSAVPLAVTIDEPAAGTTTSADRADEATGRQVATLSVAATVTGDPDAETTVTWVSDLAPDRVLLTGRSGEVELWLETPCRDTPHPLRVTVTDAVSGETATSVVQVLARHTCSAPVEVTIEQPADGTTATVEGQDDAGRPSAPVAVAATANDSSVEWQWTSDRMPGEVLLEAADGTVRLTVDGCEPVTHVLTARAERTADGSSDAKSRTILVDPTCDG